MELNWDRCVICLRDTAEPLKCPLQGPGTSMANGDKTDAYRSFLTNIEQFRAFGALPADLCFGMDETVDNFVSHSASWHKSCHLKFNNLKLERAMMKRERNPDDEGNRLNKRKSLNIQKCLFCDKGEEVNVLHEVSTFDADTNIRNMITELNDTELMTRIVGGDLIAMDAKYHLACLTQLRNRYRSICRKASQTSENTDEKMTYSRAFVELTSYIEKSMDCGTVLFRLSEIHSLFENRLDGLGIKKQVHKTRLKDQLLERFPRHKNNLMGETLF